MSQNNLLLHDVAQLLGVKPYRINYALMAGLIPEPKLRIANKRIFQRRDVAKVAKHFGVELVTANESN